MATAVRRILFLNSIDAAVWGGLEHWMEMCGLGLADRGHAIHFAGREDSEFLRHLDKYDNVDLHPLSISGDFHPATIKALAGLIKKHAIELVLCNFVKDVRLAGLAHKLAQNYKIFWTPGVNLAKKSLSHKLLMTPFVDRAIVPSKHLRDEIVASGFLKSDIFEILPIGIDEVFWTKDKAACRQKIIAKYNLPDTAVICVTSGRFVPQKGHVHLIEAARPLIKKYPDLYFLFLGDGDLEDDLRTQIKQAGMESKFIFCGLLDDHRDVVFSADIYVHPAIIEPFGIVLVEAMAASLPVIACKVGGIPEVVADGETAILVSPASPPDLTNAISRLYTDANLRETLGQGGFQRYRKRFRKATMIDKLEKLIQQELSE
ncbi:MAG: glycosyltransferase family 4 protein [Candidatus Zixiibacteriota bacterium]